MFMETKKSTAKCDFEKEFESAIEKYKTKNKGQKFNISQGKDIVVVFGNTGAGKSTLLNLLVSRP